MSTKDRFVGKYIRIKKNAILRQYKSGQGQNLPHAGLNDSKVKCKGKGKCTLALILKMMPMDIFIFSHPNTFVFI